MGRIFSGSGGISSDLSCTCSDGLQHGGGRDGLLWSPDKLQRVRPGSFPQGLWGSQGFDTLGWDVSQNANGSWHYVYVLGVPVLDANHFIVHFRPASRQRTS